MMLFESAGVWSLDWSRGGMKGILTGKSNNGRTPRCCSCTFLTGSLLVKLIH